MGYDRKESAWQDVPSICVAPLRHEDGRAWQTRAVSLQIIDKPLPEPVNIEGGN